MTVTVLRLARFAAASAACFRRDESAGARQTFGQDACLRLGRPQQYASKSPQDGYRFQKIDSPRRARQTHR